MNKKKIEIRRRMIFLRKKITYEKRKNSEKKVLEKLFSLKEIKKAKKIGIFLSFNNEINTRKIIKKLLIDKMVFVPILDIDNKRNLVFVPYKKTTRLVLNKFGIEEPLITKNSNFFFSDLDVVIIPIVAFDKFGNRIGMGKGYYDFILRDWKKSSCFPIGIAYDFQKVKKICVEEYDVPIPVIVTPKNIWYCRNKNVCVV